MKQVCASCWMLDWWKWLNMSRLPYEHTACDSVKSKAKLRRKFASKSRFCSQSRDCESFFKLFPLIIERCLRCTCIIFGSDTRQFLTNHWNDFDIASCFRVQFPHLKKKPSEYDQNALSTFQKKCSYFENTQKSLFDKSLHEKLIFHFSYTLFAPSFINLNSSLNNSFDALQNISTICGFTSKFHYSNRHSQSRSKKKYVLKSHYQSKCK